MLDEELRLDAVASDDQMPDMRVIDLRAMDNWRSALSAGEALFAPTGGPAWLIDLVNGDGGTASSAAPSTVTSVAGYPHITVPGGFFRGLPVGVSFFGRAWSERTLIKIAYAYEQATKHRKPPTFAATADLAAK